MGIFDDEDTDEARVHAAACAVADAWAAVISMHSFDAEHLLRTCPTLCENIKRLELATRSSPLRKVK